MKEENIWLEQKKEHKLLEQQKQLTKKLKKH
jgi:hypothetical protein